MPTPMPAAAQARVHIKPVARSSRCLDRLRRIAMASRMAPRRDPDRLCALVAEEEGPSVDTYGSALTRLLPIALGRRIVFHRYGSTDVTFDEAWLVGLITSIKRGDEDSTHFAIASRTPRAFHAQVRFLAEGFASRLDSVELELF